MSRALFLSPHLDDAVFSAGGLVHALTRAGWGVTVATVFTRSVPDPKGFALACQTDKGLPADLDYMAVRRAEDRLACARLGAEALHMDFEEAPHRGYEDASALFGGLRADDDAARRIAPALAALAGDEQPDLLALPQGLGGHVDHLAVIEAAAPLAARLPTLTWRDAPYVTRLPDPAPAEAATPINLGAKVWASSAYATQLGFQFGGCEPMVALLESFALVEGRGTPAEGFGASDPAARRVLETVAGVLA